MIWKCFVLRLWNSDVAPVYSDCTSFVLAQRTEVYDDLLRALQVMSIVNERTPVPNVFYAMWLLENRQLSLSANINVSEMIERDEFISSE